MKQINSQNIRGLWVFIFLITLTILNAPAWSGYGITENANFKPSEKDENIAVSKFNPPVYIKLKDERAGVQPIQFTFENTNPQNIQTKLREVFVIKDRKVIQQIDLEGFRKIFYKDSKDEANWGYSLLIAACGTTKASDNNGYNSAEYIDAKYRRCLADAEIQYQKMIDENLQKKVDEVAPYAYKDTSVIPDTIYEAEVYFPKDLKPPFKLVFTLNGKKRELNFIEK